MSTHTAPLTKWRSEMAQWLVKNPKQMPDDLKVLRQQFLERFPREHLPEMTLEEYALGHDR